MLAPSAVPFAAVDGKVVAKLAVERTLQLAEGAGTLFWLSSIQNWTRLSRMASKSRRDVLLLRDGTARDLLEGGGIR